MKTMKFSKFKIILFICLGIIFVSIGNRYNHFGMHDWRSSLWADKAGYYIYLPSAFIYGFKTENLSSDLEEKFGNGFKIDKENNKITTKYPIGVALLTLPFFLIFHFLAFILGYTPDGFSEIYFKMPIISGAFYFLIGQIFLYKFLKYYVNSIPILFSLLAICLGTNLYYYAFISSYMPHVYSFALFSGFLFILKKNIVLNFSSNKLWFSISIISALIFLTRPTNIIIFLFIIFFDIRNISELKTRIQLLFSIKKILIFLFVFILFILPQLFYWKYISGSYFHYSYGNESFIYLKNPKIIEVLFAPNNGMILYNPIILLFLIILFVLSVKRHLNSILIFSIVILSLYIISSWESFSYGCGYGCRPFVEYLSILALPIAQFISLSKKIINYFLFILGVYFIIFNLKIINKVYINNQCFFCEIWNWKEYQNHIDIANIFPLSSHNYIWSNNFNPDFTDYFMNQNKNIIEYKDANYVNYVSTSIREFSDGFKNVEANRISFLPIKNIEVKLRIKQIEVDSQAVIVCQIKLDDSVYYWHGEKISTFVKNSNNWCNFYYVFNTPYIHPASLYSIYLWSPMKKNILIDDFKIIFNYKS